MALGNLGIPLGSGSYLTRSEGAWDIPTGGFAQTYPRRLSGGSSLALLASGRMSLYGIPLRAGDVVTNISFLSGGTALGTGSNQWFSLWSLARAKLGVTSDDTSTAWASNAAKTLALASPYTVPTTGLYYVGILVVATTVPTLRGYSNSANADVLAPVLEGNADSSLTNPASAPATAASLAVTGALAYAWVS